MRRLAVLVFAIQASTAVPLSQRANELERTLEAYVDSARSEAERRGRTARWHRLNKLAIAYSDTAARARDAAQSASFDEQRSRDSSSPIPPWAWWVAVGAIASGIIGVMLLASRGRGGTGFALGFFLGPVGWIVAAIMRLEKPPNA